MKGKKKFKEWVLEVALLLLNFKLKDATDDKEFKSFSNTWSLHTLESRHFLQQSTNYICSCIFISALCHRLKENWIFVRAFVFTFCLSFPTFCYWSRWHWVKSQIIYTMYKSAGFIFQEKNCSIPLFWLKFMLYLSQT